MTKKISEEEKIRRRIQIQDEYGMRYIVKANIIVEAYHDPNMTLQEQRLIATALCKITPNMEVLDYIIFSVEEFCDIYDLDSKAMYKNIKLKCKEMLARTLHMNLGKSHWRKFQWFSEVEYKNGLIQIKFHERLKPYLLFTQKNRAYTKYLYKNIFNFKCKYSLYLYELLKQYQKIGMRSISVDELRLIIGIPDSKYPRFSTFKLRVLLPTIEEINKYTDISIKFEEIKKDKSVTEIKFYIDFNKDYITDFNKVPKENLVTYIVTQYRNKTGFFMMPKYFLDLHRIVLIDLIEIIDRGEFANIQNPKAYMLWQIKESIEKFDPEGLKKVVDY